MNFLEQLTIEWLTFEGYFVRSNIKFNKRTRGGYGGEIDVLGYNPRVNTLVHYETSMDADSNEKRILKFNNKFLITIETYNSLLGTQASEVEKYAIVGFSKTKINLGNGIIHNNVPEFINKITNSLKQRDPMKQAVPESLSLLRAIQFSSYYANKSNYRGQSVISCPIFMAESRDKGYRKFGFSLDGRVDLLFLIFLLYLYGTLA